MIPGSSPYETPLHPQRLIDALLDGSASPADVQALGRWITADPTHADRFTRQSLLHGHLQVIRHTHAELREFEGVRKLSQAPKIRT